VIFIITAVLLTIISCADGDIGETLLDEAIKKSTYLQTPGYGPDATYIRRTDTLSDGGSTIDIGEDTTDESYLTDGYFTFQTTLLTANGVTPDRIVYAAVYIKYVGYNGNPTNFGSFHVDHVSAVSPGTVISQGIYSFNVPDSDIYWTVIPVTEQLKADIAFPRTTTTYRIYAADVYYNSIFDLVKFASGEDSDPNHTPYLAVWYL
jgi:hypothetical protein